MTGFDLAMAKDKAAAKASEDTDLMAGAIGLDVDYAIEAIAGNPDLSNAERARLLNLLNERVSAALKGTVPAKPRSDDGDKTDEDDDTPDGDDKKTDSKRIAELKRELEQAEQVNTAHAANTKLLRDLVSGLPFDSKIGIPPDSGEALPSSTARDVIALIKKELKKAKDEGRAESSGLDMEKVKKAFNDVAAARKKLASKLTSTKVQGTEELETELKKLRTTLGLSGS